MAELGSQGENIRVPELENVPILKIAAVDDDERLLKITERMMRIIGGDTITIYDTFTNPEKALKEIQANPNKYNVLLTDGQMPNIDGLALAESVKDKVGTIVLISGGMKEVDLDDKELMQAKGICFAFPKPFDLDEVKNLLPKICDSVKLK